MNIGFIALFTGRYNELFPGFYESLKHVKNKFTLYVFTDRPKEYSMYDNVVPLYIKHELFPTVLYKKFAHILSYKDVWMHHDYIVVLLSNMRFTKDYEFNVEEDLLIARHPCGIKDYYAGGFLGGKLYPFIQLCEWCNQWLMDQLSQGKIPEWQDETALNTYINKFTLNICFLPDSFIYAGTCENALPENNTIFMVYKEDFFGCSRAEFSKVQDNATEPIDITISINDKDLLDGLCIQDLDDYLSLQDVRDINNTLPGNLQDFTKLKAYKRLYNAICKALNLCHNRILILNFNNLTVIISKKEILKLKDDMSINKVINKCDILFNSIK